MHGLSKVTENRNLGLSLIRVLSSLGIVYLHTANVSEILYREELSKTAQSFTLLGVYCFLWAVPCFLMVSGSLLLEPSRSLSIGKIWKKYISRILLALFVFQIFFSFFDSFMDEEPLTLHFLVDGIYNAFSGKGWAHLWYLYLLIGLYALTPLFRLIAEKQKLLNYHLLVFFIFLSIFPALSVFHITPGFYIPIASIYPFYFLMGYTLRKNKPRPLLSILLFFTGTLGIILLTFLRYLMELEQLDPLITSYSSPFVVLSSVGIFSFLFSCADKNQYLKKVKKPLLFFDENGFGVYLIHMVFLRLVLRYWEINPYEWGVPFFLLFPLLVYALSAFIIALIRKFPILRKLL